MNIILLILGTYLGIGLLFAVPFALRLVGRVDPAAAGAPWSFRLLIIPGCCALWPVLLLRMRGGGS